MRDGANQLFTLVSGLLLTYGVVQADIITDGSLGAATNLSGPNFEIDASLGRQEGGNLFHSFSEFSIAAGESATFNGDASVNNIISRVTGGSASQIDGALTWVSGASLYLINPKGVLFGEGVQIDVPGSLYVSTADQLRFVDDGVFSASLGGADVLTAAAPTAFGFLTASPATIQIHAKRFAAFNHSLNFIGGDIEINPTGSVVDGQDGIFSDKGEISLVSSAGNNQINLVDGRPQLGEQAGGTISLSGNALVETNTYTNENAGNLFIQADTLSLSDQARIESDTKGVGETGNAGSISIVVKTLTLSDEAHLSSSTINSGNAGEINVTADQINVSDQASIASNISSGSGNAGRIHLKADQSIKMTGKAAINSVAHENTTGHAGDIFIETPYLSIIGEGEIDGEGDAARDSAQIAVDTKANSTGEGGYIQIESDHIHLENGATITVKSEGSGNAGYIEIKGNNRLDANESFISAESVNADGGNVTINTRLVVLDNSQISANSAGANGGRLDIQSTVVRTPNSTITARGVEQAQDGEVSITDEINLDQALSDLELNFLTNEVKAPCSVTVAEESVVLNVSETRSCHR
jgi:filamentous hemagglutinin family protein